MTTEGLIEFEEMLDRLDGRVIKTEEKLDLDKLTEQVSRKIQERIRDRISY